MKRIISLMVMIVMTASLFSVAALADGDPTIRVSSVEAEPGDTVTVEVSLENNPGIMAFVLGLEYDETRLESVKFSHSGLQGLWAMSENAVWVGSGDDTYEGVFLKLKFRVLEDAPAGEAEVTITYTEGGICNYDEESIDFAVVSGGVTVSGAAGTEGTQSESTVKPDAADKPDATEKPAASDNSESTEKPAEPGTTKAPEDGDASETEETDEPAPLAESEGEPVAAEENHETADEAETTVVTAEHTAPVLVGSDSPVADGERSISGELLLILALAVVAVALIVVILVVIRKGSSYKGKH